MMPGVYGSMGLMTESPGKRHRIIFLLSQLLLPHLLLSHFFVAVGMLTLAVSPGLASADQKPAKILVKTPITFSINGKKSEIPFIGVTVGRQHCWFVLDSGANMMLLSSEAARRLKLKREDSLSSLGRDHGGNPIQTRTIAPFKIQFDGSSSLVEVIDVVSSELPSNLEDEGICGMLSPQSLLRQESAVAIDFSKNSLTYFSGVRGEKLLNQVGALVPGFSFTKLNTLQALGPNGRVVPNFLMVGASIAGKSEEKVVIDSGSPATRFPPNYFQASSNDKSSTYSAANLTLVFAHHHIALPSVDLSTTRTVEDGVIGMDVLNKMAIVLPFGVQEVYLGF
jgi:hypothetical protein